MNENEARTAIEDQYKNDIFIYIGQKKIREANKLQKKYDQWVKQGRPIFIKVNK